MTENYYIISENAPEGPFDSLSLLRKIRNGQLTPETMLSTSLYTSPQAAKEFSELASLFAEMPEAEKPLEPFQTRPAHLGTLLKKGADGFLSNQSIALYFATLLIVVSGISIVLTPILNAGIIFPMVAPFALTSVMLLCAIALRQVRRRPTGLEFFNAILGAFTRPYIIASFVIGTLSLSLPLILATAINPVLAFLVLLLSPILAVHSFAPFYIADHPELTPFEAMQRSHEAVSHLGTSSLISLSILWGMISLTYGTVVLGLIFIPIAVTGLAEYYEENLSA